MKGRDPGGVGGLCVGVYARWLGRAGLVVPSAFRGLLPARKRRVRVAVGFSGRAAYLVCFPLVDEKKKRALAARRRRPGVKRAMDAPRLVILGMDARGRIRPPGRCLRFAGLTVGRPVAVVGALDSFELWAPARLARSNAAAWAAVKIAFAPGARRGGKGGKP